MGNGVRAILTVRNRSPRRFFRRSLHRHRFVPVGFITRREFLFTRSRRRSSSRCSRLRLSAPWSDHGALPLPPTPNSRAGAEPPVTDAAHWEGTGVQPSVERFRDGTCLAAGRCPRRVVTGLRRLRTRSLGLFFLIGMDSLPRRAGQPASTSDARPVRDREETSLRQVEDGSARLPEDESTSCSTPSPAGGRTISPSAMLVWPPRKANPRCVNHEKHGTTTAYADELRGLGEALSRHVVFFQRPNRPDPELRPPRPIDVQIVGAIRATGDRGDLGGGSRRPGCDRRSGSRCRRYGVRRRGSRRRAQQVASRSRTSAEPAVSMSGTTGAQTAGSTEDRRQYSIAADSQYRVDSVDALNATPIAVPVSHGKVWPKKPTVATSRPRDQPLQRPARVRRARGCRRPACGPV